MKPIDQFKDLVARLSDEDLKRYVSNTNYLDVYILGRYLTAAEISRLGKAMGEGEEEKLLKLNVILPIRLHTVYDSAVERLVGLFQQLKADGKVKGALAAEPLPVDAEKAAGRIALFREVALNHSDNLPESIRQLTELRMAAEIDLTKFDLKAFLSKALPLLDRALGNR